MANTKSKSTLEHLPFYGEWFLAPKKKYKETILFVPFYGGHKTEMKRHRDFVNQLGYDCVLFHLMNGPKTISRSLFSSQINFGLKHIWCDQIERILTEIPGKKIIYAFSIPSASAIEAIARRKAIDIKGLVCDSGPSNSLWTSTASYFKGNSPLHFFPLRAVVATWVSLIWEPPFVTSLHEDLSKLPKNFRILSVRGWKDKLVSPEMIDATFEPHHQLNWQKMSLPQAGHINGLKKFASDYEPAVSQFLNEISTPID